MSKRKMIKTALEKPAWFCEERYLNLRDFNGYELARLLHALGKSYLFLERVTTEIEELSEEERHRYFISLSKVDDYVQENYFEALLRDYKGGSAEQLTKPFEATQIPAPKAIENLFKYDLLGVEEVWEIAEKYVDDEYFHNLSFNEVIRKALANIENNKSLNKKDEAIASDIDTLEFFKTNTFVRVNLELPDDKLLEWFSNWLEQERRFVGVEIGERDKVYFTKHKVIEYKVIEYLELEIWSIIHNVKFTHNAYGEILFNDVKGDSTDRFRKNTLKFVHKFELDSDELNAIVRNLQFEK